MTSDEETTIELRHALDEVPVLDPHTHLVGGQLVARGLHDILLYHMVVSDLYAAGCPSGARLTEYPLSPSQEEAESRIEEALPYLPLIRNTSSYWGVRIILDRLYKWTATITRENWKEVDSLIRERSHDANWGHSLLDRLNVHRSGTEIARRGTGADDDRLQYALEWGFFTRCQWGEFDTALYELERCWGRSPESPSPIGKGRRPATEKSICDLTDVHKAINHYVNAIPYSQVLATATHISTDIRFRFDVSDAEMEAALAKRSHAGAAERDIYASYIQEAFLTALEPHASEIVYQFSLGAEPLPFETAARCSQQTIAELAEMIGRHPKLRFQCFLASRHANQSLCSLARELPNLSLAGCWWHNVFPDTSGRIIRERLDMLPMNKQIAFFSDAYCVEWTFAKLAIFRRQLAKALSEREIRGQYSRQDSLAVAKAILFESPQTLLGMKPRA